MANILTVYYSHKGENYFPDGIKFLYKGNTEYAAEYIQKAVGGDVFEIDTRHIYPSNYQKCIEVAKKELQTNARPEIINKLDSLDDYDTIFVCYPNWWGTVPMCILTFLESYDLTGKKLIPLCTNEGSGMGTSERDLEKYCKGAVVVPGLAVRGHKAETSEAEIAAWAKSKL